MGLSAPELGHLAEALFQAPVGVAFVDPDGRLVRVNATCCDLLREPEAALLGRPFSDLFDADRDLAAAQFREAAAPGGPEHHESRRTLRRRDGTRVDTTQHCRFVRDADGTCRYVLVFLHDVTDTLAVARALEATEGTLEQAFELAPFGMAVLDPSLRLRLANTALAAIFGLPPEELVGRSYLELLHPDERARAEKWLTEATQGAEKTRQVERRFLDGRGRTIHLSTGGARLTIHGEDLYISVFIDVTERRVAEAERALLQEQVLHAERLRTLGQIAGGIAHEVNNPAAITVGGVDLARRHIAAVNTAVKAGDLAAVRQHVERLEASLKYCEDGSARLAKVARKLGAFSALHGGEFEPADVNGLVRKAVDLVENDLRHRAQLVVDLGELPPIVVHPGRLVLALTNLLVNAAQAIDGLPADHRISVSTRHEGGEIQIVVADTGVGVPSGLVERIFEPFFSTRGPKEGSGLGLTVVNDVVRQHRGRVEVRSEPGRGSRFVVHLPLANGLGGSPAQPAPHMARARVLVIDDEPFILAILSEILEVEHDVVTAGGGPEALDLLAGDTGFDAVLCDLMMPGVDGIAVHRHLLETAPALAARTVFSTGGAFTARAESYVTNLNLPVLLKPFTVEEVRSAVSTALASPSHGAPRRG